MVLNDFCMSEIEAMVKFGYSLTTVKDRLQANDYDDLMATYLLLGRVGVRQMCCTCIVKTLRPLCCRKSLMN